MSTRLIEFIKILRRSKPLIKFDKSNPLVTKSADLFYTGSTKDQEQRLIYHGEKEFKSSFTAKYSDWALYFSIDNLNVSTAKKTNLFLKFD